MRRFFLGSIVALVACSCDHAVVESRPTERIAEVRSRIVGKPWKATGSMATARNGQLATLLPTGNVLVVGGTGGVTTAELYEPAAGIFTATGSPGNPGAATLLASGKVLFTGGGTGDDRFAWIYDPATGTCIQTGSMVVQRKGHTATLLPSGKVLVAGAQHYYGGGVEPRDATAELYDPATGVFAATASMHEARAYHTASLLPSGKVLVVGGYTTGGYPTSSELYDPATETWAVTGGSAWWGFVTATLLPSGKVLLVGNGAGLYDPALDTFTATGVMTVPRVDFTANLLPSGRVLVTGGRSAFVGGTLHSSAEIYDPATGLFTATGSMTSVRANHSATVLATGKVLVAGGQIGVKEFRAKTAELFALGGPGASCDAVGDCSAGYCVDGMCCDTACDTACHACTSALKQSGADGTCGPVKDSSDPHNSCAADESCKAGSCTSKVSIPDAGPDAGDGSTTPDASPPPPPVATTPAAPVATAPPLPTTSPFSPGASDDAPANPAEGCSAAPGIPASTSAWIFAVLGLALLRRRVH